MTTPQTAVKEKLDMQDRFPYPQTTQKQVLIAPGKAWRIQLVEKPT